MFPLISVVIPIYNAENTILDTLASIENQSFKNYEVLLINDGSNDNSEQVCKNFIQLKANYKYLYQDNAGVSNARNRGIREAVGKYLLFVDADDILVKNCIEILINNICDEYLLCASHRMLKTRNRSVDYVLKNEVYEKTEPRFFLECLKKIPLAPWSKLYNREIIIKNNLLFPPEIPYGEDAIFLFNYLLYVKGVKTIENIVYLYSFLDSFSAGRRFYSDYNIYLLTQHQAKMKLYEQISLKEDEEDIDAKNCFRRCLEHYIIHQSNKNDCLMSIENSFKCFPSSLSDLEFGSLLNKKNFLGVKRYWIKQNLLLYIKEKIKILL